MFDGFTQESKRTTKKKRSKRKKCNLPVPVKVQKLIINMYIPQANPKRRPKFRTSSLYLEVYGRPVKEYVNRVSVVRGSIREMKEKV